MANFDHAVIERPDGTKQHLSKEEFYKLPLLERVKALSELRVQFYKGGTRVAAMDAVQ